MQRLAFALCLFPLAATAQAIDCSTETTQLEMNICTLQEYKAADADLNAVYADVIATLQTADAEYPTEGASEESRLRAAQRAWVAFRDLNCDVAGYQMRGGSAEPLLINSCLRAMTEARITDLLGLVETY
jgi:uncharacterized protein YecT (DUF1311 family)